MGPHASAESPPSSILIVEDDEDAASLLAEYLQMLGHDVQTAGDGTSALALVASFVPTLAIVDLGLPGMDGYELVGRLHAQLADLRVVALSGSVSDADRQRSRDAGFTAHLTKPVDVKALRDLISAA